MSIIKMPFILVCIVFLSACANKPISLNQEASKKIRVLDQHILIPQNNLNVVIESSNPGNSGLLGALIFMAVDATRRENALERAEPFIEALRKYDFRVAMLNAMQSKIKENPLPHYKINVAMETVNSKSNKSAIFNQSNASAIMFIHTYYALHNTNLVVQAVAEIYPKSEHLYAYRKKPNNKKKLDKGNLIYKNSFTHTQQAVTVSEIESSLTEAANSIAAQVIQDLANPTGI